MIERRHLAWVAMMVLAVAACSSVNRSAGTTTLEATSASLDAPATSAAPSATVPSMTVRSDGIVYETAAEPTSETLPNLGSVSDVEALIDALRAAGPIDNQTAAAAQEGRNQPSSICADIVSGEAKIGTLVHVATADVDGLGGVVLVYERPDGSRHVRLYGTGDADPFTGGCPLLLSGEL